MAKKINASECPKCQHSQNELIDSFSEQAKLLNQNIQLAQENKKLWEDKMRLMNDIEKLLNVVNRLDYLLFCVIKNQNPKNERFINGFYYLLNEYPARHKGFYFSENMYKIIFQENTSSHKWNRSQNLKKSDLFMIKKSIDCFTEILIRHILKN